MAWYEKLLMVGLFLQLTGFTWALLLRIRAHKKVKGGRAKPELTKFDRAAFMIFNWGTCGLSIASIYIIEEILKR
jgi:hypothetical protein